MKKILLFYLLFITSFVVFSYSLIDPNFFYLHRLFTDLFQTHRLLITLIFISFIILFFGFYLLFLWQLGKGRGTNTIFVWIISISSLLLFSYPAMVSFDIFNYIATAKVTYLYKENPYITMPIEFQGDSILRFMHAPNKIALYGPVWIVLTAIPFRLGFGNFLVILLNFKIFVALFYYGIVFLLFKETKCIIKTAVFALNPLVLFETFVSGHNDSAMMFVALLATVLLLHKQKTTSLLLWVSSLLMKYATFFLLPAYIYKMKAKHFSEKSFFILSILGMYIIFFLSAFREEIYPWYSIWFLTFLPFVWGGNLVTVLSITFSFSLLLRYIPFMLLGTYFGPTPLIKILFTFIPVVISLLIARFRYNYKIW